MEDLLHLLNKNACVSTHMVQTHVVQGTTVLFMCILLYLTEFL